MGCTIPGNLIDCSQTVTDSHNAQTGQKAGSIMRGNRYEIAYYPLDERGAVLWEQRLDREGAIGADKAMEYAKSWLTMDRDRECRIIPGEFAGELTIKAGVVGSPEDLVATIERYYVDHAGVENI